jgi:hypothetical protein
MTYAIRHTRRAQHRINRMPGPRRWPLTEALETLAQAPDDPDTTTAMSDNERRAVIDGCIIDYYLVEEVEIMLVLAVYVTYSGLPDDNPPPVLAHPDTAHPAHTRPVTLPA